MGKASFPVKSSTVDDTVVKGKRPDIVFRKSFGMGIYVSTKRVDVKREKGNLPSLRGREKCVPVATSHSTCLPGDVSSGSKRSGAITPCF